MTDDRLPPAEERSKLDDAPAADGVEPWLVALLACPVDRGAMRAEGDALVCQVCDRRYPVRDGIPVMIAEEAE